MRLEYGRQVSETGMWKTEVSRNETANGVEERMAKGPHRVLHDGLKEHRQVIRTICDLIY